VDFAHRYPAVYAWLKDCLGREWDGKISFLGFVWVETFLTVKNPPADVDDWIAFMRKCETASRDFRKNVGTMSSSEITLVTDGEP